MENPLAKGIGQFLGGGLSAFLETKGKKDEENALHELYTNSINRLNSLINPPPKVQPINRFGGTVETEQKPDYKKGLQFLYETLPQFTEYGDKGATYGNLLSSYYKSSQPEKEEPVLREVNGQIIDFQDIKNPKVLYGKPKEEKKKTTTGQYLNMTTDELLNLPVDELENVFLTLPEEKQTELTAKMPYLQQKKDLFYKEGDFAPKSRSFKTGTFKATDFDNRTIKDLQNYNEYNSNFNSLTYDQITDRRNLELQLQERLNLTEDDLKDLAGEVGNTTSTQQANKLLKGKDEQYNNAKEVQKFYTQVQDWQGKIEQAWGRYDLTPEDWIGEMTKHGLFDGEITDDYLDALKTWFKNKTGQELTDYVNLD